MPGGLFLVCISPLLWLLRIISRGNEHWEFIDPGDYGSSRVHVGSVSTRLDLDSYSREG
jgi:hypothetical protein